MIYIKSDNVVYDHNIDMTFIIKRLEREEREREISFILRVPSSDMTRYPTKRDHSVAKCFFQLTIFI